MKWITAGTIGVLVALLVLATGAARRAIAAADQAQQTATAKAKEADEAKALQTMAEHQMLADANAIAILRAQLTQAHAERDARPRVVYEPCHVPAFSGDSRTHAGR